MVDGFQPLYASESVTNLSSHALQHTNEVATFAWCFTPLCVDNRVVLFLLCVWCQSDLVGEWATLHGVAELQIAANSELGHDTDARMSPIASHHSSDISSGEDKLRHPQQYSRSVADQFRAYVQRQSSRAQNTYHDVY